MKAFTMSPRDAARLQAEALFKPVSSPIPAPSGTALNPFDSIKRRAALAHAIDKLRRSHSSGSSKASGVA